jgi:hypothetical protein
VKEPARNSDIHSLWEPFRLKVEALLAAMARLGEDPVIYEALRSKKRQEYLYSIGRTRDKHRRPVTFTLESRHRVGKAVDIISKRHGWNDPAFFQRLKHEAAKLSLHTLDFEQCHVEWTA